MARRGVWRPPHPEPAPPPVADPTFHEFAPEWWASKRDELSRKTQIDYEWQLSNHLLPFFARHRLTQITVAEVDRYRNAKVAERALSAASI
jgi:integrase